MSRNYDETLEGDKNADCGLRNAECHGECRASEPASWLESPLPIRNPQSTIVNCIVSSPHRPVAPQAPGPGEAIRRDPDPEPHQLPREAARHRRALPGPGEDFHGKSEHVGEPQ